MPTPRSPGGWASHLPLPALRQRIGRHVLGSLVLIWGLGSAVILAVGNHFVAEAFDRTLLDDAHGLAAHVRGGAGGEPLQLALTQREVGILLLDQSAGAPFAVYGGDGALIAGDPELVPDAVTPARAQAFSNMVRDGREWRRVSLRVAGPPSFTVVMAEATETRSQLLRRLLIYSGLAQLWLLVVLGSRLLRGIEKHLRPLAALQDAVQQRDAADLQPLPAALTQ